MGDVMEKKRIYEIAKEEGLPSSLLLQRLQRAGVNVKTASSTVDVAGGPGGTQTGSNTARRGGVGGDGYIRVEDAFGGMVIPGGTAGVFDPVGGGVVSIVYSLFADLGVQDPRFVNYTDDDLLTVPGNDAIFVEIQVTREDPSVFGEPDLSAIDVNQDSTDTTITSAWTSLKIHDKTGIPGGAFPGIPGYDAGRDGLEYTFPIDQLNGQGFRFVRYRITFQLDDGHRRDDPRPFVDNIILHFQFNF